MSNDYKEEFDTKMSLAEFDAWMKRNMDGFVANLRPYHPKDLMSLRTWMAYFVAWCEYDENKDE